MRTDMQWGTILNPNTLQKLKEALKPLIGAEISYLKIPVEAASKFEPSQIGTIVGTLTDAVLPYIALEKKVGLIKSIGILGEREGYPDFIHEAGYRLELKGLFIDNPDITLKKPPTRREPSARLTQKVTMKNVQPDKDGLLIISYRLEQSTDGSGLLTPVILDLDIIPVIECVQARDFRLSEKGGMWFGDYQTPTILSKAGKAKATSGIKLDKTTYGRKESEGKDFNEDTNFGKLKRIPYKPLQEFLCKNGAHFSFKGNYPSPWTIKGFEQEAELSDEDDTI